MDHSEVMRYPEDVPELTDDDGNPIEDALPSTLQRSDAKAEATFAKAHDSALDTYDGDEQRANRVAWGAVKHTHEKVGDHWEPKDSYGPSDDHAAQGRTSPAPTAEGVDANASKQHLYDVAKRLDVRGRSRMTAVTSRMCSPLALATANRFSVGERLMSMTLAASGPTAILSM